MFRLPGAVDRILALLRGWPRRLAALICLACAALSAVRPGPRSGSASDWVLVAGRALAPGVVLTAGDLRSVRWPAASVPVDALRRPEQATGRRVSTTLARGQPIQPDDLLEPAVAAALSQGKVATTVTLADRHQAAILTNGAHIDLYGAAEDGQASGTAVDSKPLARDVTVLAILPTAETAESGALGLIIATDPTTAERVAARLSTPLIATLIPP